ncbi:MAG: hypothetical protein JJU02_04490 [Cryomorphaceae bacterium]|nr:hypothetical protein [Cryomorphaceae bacterium]
MIQSYTQKLAKLFKPSFFVRIGSLVFLFPEMLWAQPQPPGAPSPIDGGLVALLAAGAFYGVKKYRQQK